MRTSYPILAAVLLTLPAGGALEAQATDLSPLAATAAAGAFAFDLSGVGTAPMAAVRLSHDLGGDLRVEGAVVVALPRQQFGQTTTFLAPELQLQWAPVEVWRAEPYLGVGLGWSHDIRDDMDDVSRETFSASLGTRVRVTPSSGFVGEMRLRYIETDFVGSAGDFTLGWYHRVGG